ncbi:MAG: potassium channel family protein [Halothiobacillaceae bacterium]
MSTYENARARRWAARLEVLVALAVLWLPFSWYAEAKGVIDLHALRILDLGVWALFLFELLVLSLLVNDRWRYWRQNWLNLVIVLGGVPLLLAQHDTSLALLRLLRLALLLVVVIRMARHFLRMMARHALAATLVIALFLTVSIGTLVASIDPNFDSLGDGLWWALVTISTVGYGDVVPATPEGRWLGAILILFGVLTFSMVMANLAAALVSMEVEETSEEIEREEVRHELLILQRLEALEERFDRLERLLLERQGKAGDDKPT